MRNNVLASLAAGVTLLVLGNSAQALDNIFTFTTDQLVYSAPAGSDVAVKVYLTETRPSGNDPFLLVVEGGLAGTGVLLSTSDASPAAQVLSTSDIVVNPSFVRDGGVFDYATPTVISSQTSSLVAAMLSDVPNPFGPPFGVLGSVDGNNYSIFLGTFHYTAGAVSASSTFVVDDNEFTAAHTQTWLNLINLDGYDYPLGTHFTSQISPGDFRIDVTASAVPLPSAVSGGLILLGGAFARQLLRRRGEKA